MSKTGYGFDSLLIFNFEKYNKVYFIAIGSGDENIVFDDPVEYVFDKTNKKLTQASYQKFFTPREVLGYSPNGRYLAVWAHRAMECFLLFLIFKKINILEVSG